MSALATYELMVATGGYVGWASLAADLRAEAATFDGGLRTKRLDRAADCDARAVREARR